MDITWAEVTNKLGDRVFSTQNVWADIQIREKKKYCINYIKSVPKFFSNFPKTYIRKSMPTFHSDWPGVQWAGLLWRPANSQMLSCQPPANVRRSWTSSDRCRVYSQRPIMNLQLPRATAVRVMGTTKPCRQWRALKAVADAPDLTDGQLHSTNHRI